jgi:hypothetical protein
LIDPLRIPERACATLLQAVSGALFVRSSEMPFLTVRK